LSIGFTYKYIGLKLRSKDILLRDTLIKTCPSIPFVLGLFDFSTRTIFFKIGLLFISAFQYISTKWVKQETQSIAKTMVTRDREQVIDNPALEKRAKRKVVSRTMIHSLVDVTKSKGDTDKVNSYWNAWHFQNSVLIKDRVMCRNYCKNRFCTVCIAIRKAENINKYNDTKSKWKDIQFVNLTVKAQAAKNLNKWIARMIGAFRVIKNRMKKCHQRGQG
jgi:hypothetical protein